MCSVYLLVVQPITVGGKSSCWELEDGERVEQCTLDLISISGCWTGLFQPFSLPEPEAAVVCWDLFGRQPSVAVFTKHLHQDFQECCVGTLTASVDHEQSSSSVVGLPLLRV